MQKQFFLNAALVSHDHTLGGTEFAMQFHDQVGQRTHGQGMFVRPGFKRQPVDAVNSIRHGPLIFFGQVPPTPTVVKMSVSRQTSIPFTPPKFSHQERRSIVFAKLKPFQIDQEETRRRGGGWGGIPPRKGPRVDGTVLGRFWTVVK